MTPTVRKPAVRRAISLAIGIITGVIVWNFVLKCDDPHCPIRYYHLFCCLTIFPSLSWTTGEALFAPQNTPPEEKT